jgi:L-alanine-DL-glutamate epimerase-like enolase superfamily enzyme
VTRRRFLAGLPLGAGALAIRVPGLERGRAPAVLAPKATDIRLEEVRHRFEDFRYGTPMKFGGREVDRVTMLHVEVAVRTRDGRRARGASSMPLGNVWAYPSRQLPFEQTLGAMRALAARMAPLLQGCPEYGHPIDLGVMMEAEYVKAAADMAKGATEAIPKLATLVVASPFDAAVHDAFGRAHGRSAYHTYGPEFCSYDLGRHLGPDFTGEFADRHVGPEPRTNVSIYHAVGASDPLDDSDPFTRVNDGLPETLAEWVPRDGLDRFKIKMNGDAADWDVERVLRVERIVAAAERPRGVKDWLYSLDFNERCPNVEYLLEVVRRIREGSPSAFDRIVLLEQPTRRDLEADRHNVMHEAAKLRPVVIDESLTDLETLRLAREMGYTGIALKACKGQTQTLLMSAAGRKYGMFLTVQDLTCPGAAYIHSIGIAARVVGVSGIEANARQYVPSASVEWAKRFPALFTVKDGRVDTSGLTGPGLGT